MSNNMLPKNIFLLWLQGWEHASVSWLNKQVVESWQINNPDWKIHYIDLNNLKDYVSDIDYIYDTKKNITPQAKSDIIRLSLLKNHGGVWADATMLCMQSLDNWVHTSVEPAGFWMYHGHGAKLRKETGPASWFIVSMKDNYVITKWKEACDIYWNHNHAAHHYCWMDHLFKNIIEHNEQCLELWAKVPYVYCELDGQAHTLAHHGMEKNSPYMKELLTRFPPYALKFWSNWNILFPDITTEKCKNSNGYCAIQLSKRKWKPQTK